MDELVRTLNNDNFQTALDKYPGGIYVVDFWATWCGPCKMMGPIIDELAEAFAGTAKFGKVDIADEKNADLVEKYDIRSIPTIKIFRDGDEINSITGLTPKEDLDDAITRAINQLGK